MLACDGCGSDVCSGHGECDANFTCACDDGWGGEACRPSDAALVLPTATGFVSSAIPEGCTRGEVKLGIDEAGSSSRLGRSSALPLPPERPLLPALSRIL